jgi:hypothetical protein
VLVLWCDLRVCMALKLTRLLLPNPFDPFISLNFRRGGVERAQKVERGKQEVC